VSGRHLRREGPSSGLRQSAAWRFAHLPKPRRRNETEWFCRNLHYNHPRRFDAQIARSVRRLVLLAQEAPPLAWRDSPSERPWMSHEGSAPFLMANGNSAPLGCRMGGFRVSDYLRDTNHRAVLQRASATSSADPLTSVTCSPHAGNGAAGRFEGRKGFERNTEVSDDARTLRSWRLYQGLRRNIRTFLCHCAFGESRRVLPPI